MKATAYSTLVCPILEYATVVWDRYQQYLINNIEMVQRIQRAARWIHCLNVASIVLILFFKFLHQDPLIIRIPDHYLPSILSHCTRLTHYLHYILPSTSTTYFQDDIFPRVSSLVPSLIGIIYLIKLLKVRCWIISFFP